MTPAIKALIIANVALFVAGWFSAAVANWLGLRPAEVVGHGQLWRSSPTCSCTADGFPHPVQHAGAVDVRRRAGTDVGHALLSQVLLRLRRRRRADDPRAVVSAAVDSRSLYYSLTIGASGAVYGVLLAYALYFPHRPILMIFVFPVPAKYFVMIIGAISLLSSLNASSGGVAHTTHLGGLVAGYLYLKRPRLNVNAEIQYRVSSGVSTGCAGSSTSTPAAAPTTSIGACIRVNGDQTEVTVFTGETEQRRRTEGPFDWPPQAACSDVRATQIQAAECATGAACICVALTSLLSACFARRPIERPHVFVIFVSFVVQRSPFVSVPSFLL